MMDYDTWKTTPPEDEVSDKDYEEAMEELIDRMSAVDVFETPGTESLIRESFNNDVVKVLTDKGLDLNDDEFVDALLDILHTMTSGALMMTVTGLAEVVREYLNDKAIERAEENAKADLAPDYDDRDDYDY